MPSPKNQELGIKSPKRLRGGIDFSTWEGLNLQNDPGAIRDTQFTELINVRIDGNEVISRGGEEKIHDQAMTGCVYGMIDVPGGATSLLLARITNIQGNVIDRYYTEATPAYNTLLPTGSQELPQIVVEEPSNSRRVLARFGGRIYVLGKLDPPNTDIGLYQIILPPRDTPITGTSSTDNQVKLELAFLMSNFTSSVSRQENISSGIEPVPQEILYIGRGNSQVYRWDGTSLTTEDTNLPGGRIVVFDYNEDIWAVAADKLRKRNGGTWDVEFTLPASATAYAAAQYYSYAVIASGGDLQIFDGSTFTTHSPTDGSVISDVIFFDDYLYYIYMFEGLLNGVAVGRWDGSTFEDTVFVDDSEAEVFEAGCLEVTGGNLFFTYVGSAGATFPGYNLFSTPAGTFSATLLYNEAELASTTAYDMRAF